MMHLRRVRKWAQTSRPFAPLRLLYTDFAKRRLPAEFFLPDFLTPTV